uniref:MFS transporter n=1 Tax=Ndongobacter massiliensis TaxID=1871025 RepID=UPI000A84BFB9
MIKNKDFTILLLGRLLTNFGDSIYSIAASLLVYELSGSVLASGFMLFLTSFTAIIQLLFSPVLDRINMRKFLIFSQLLQAILVLALPLLLHTGKLQVVHVMVLTPLIALVNQLVYPGQIALLPKILSKEELVKGNAFFTMAYQGSNALFDTAAGLLLAGAGYLLSLFCNSAVFFMTAILFTFLSRAGLGDGKRVEKEMSKNPFKGYRNRLKEGLSLFRESRLQALLIGIIAINFAATGVTAVLPAFTGNKIFYSLMMAAMGGGVLLGAFASGLSFFKNCALGKLYIVGMALVGIFWLSSSQLQHLPAGALVFYAGGWVVIGIVNVYAQTMVQRLVPQQNMGGAMGVMMGLSTLLAPFGALSGGWIGETLGSVPAIRLASLLILLVSLYWGWQPSLRTIPTFEAMEGGERGREARL